MASNNDGGLFLVDNETSHEVGKAEAVSIMVCSVLTRHYELQWNSVKIIYDPEKQCG